jgi:hypothetical protein
VQRELLRVLILLKRFRGKEQFGHVDATQLTSRASGLWLFEFARPSLRHASKLRASC